MDSSLNDICPLCHLRTVEFADHPTPWHHAFCTRVADCGYKTPDFHDDESVVAYHNAQVDEQKAFALDAFQSDAETFDDWLGQKGLS